MKFNPSLVRIPKQLERYIGIMGTWLVDYMLTCLINKLPHACSLKALDHLHEGELVLHVLTLILTENTLGTDLSQGSPIQ